MKELTLKVAHEEALSLLQRGVVEFEEGETHTGVSLLLEAQFLLGEVIQQQLNKMDSPPHLSPLSDEGPGEGGQPVLAAVS